MTAQARQLGGRYEVGELLGYGGMAEVHRGRDLRLGRDVAIKMLRTDLARDQTFQERFRREAQHAAALNHPAIVAVYDTGEETAATGEKLPFIVMEYVNGRTLKEVLAAEGRLMPRRALEITADMCAALEFSHRHGIIHRDVKPGNVMLTQNGQVKVMDFGIARALASGASTMTQTSAVIGTAQYLSPEQARGESVDARSDVYAAGCVLFELLCGHPPFVGDSPVSVAYQHVREEPPTPSELNPDVPPDLDAIVLKALSKNPLNRYQSAQEMRADVLRAVSGRPVLATPVMRDDETMAIAPTHRPAGATRPIPASVGGPPPPPRRTSSWVMAALAGLGVLAVIALVVGLYFNSKKPDPTAQSTTQVEVPKVTGETEDTAKERLQGLKLTFALGDPDTSDKCVVGRVTDQAPLAGTKLSEGETVTVNVCEGPGTVPVPDLRGLDKDSAEKRVTDAELRFVPNDVDGTQPEGTVVGWSPQGRSVPKDSPIRVDISRGNQAEVPDVLSQTRQGAEALLKDRGFDPIAIVKPVAPDRDEKVVDQSPKGKSKATKGSKVTFTVEVPRPASPSPTITPTPTNSAPGPGPGGGGLPLPD
ncbi:MAG TPA: Stk1 family PASTA domain-containing Ser/Thr kinase [Catenuloplanes sp.]|jgi:serine/threonine-protein kinase